MSLIKCWHFNSIFFLNEPNTKVSLAIMPQIAGQNGFTFLMNEIGWYACNHDFNSMHKNVDEKSQQNNVSVIQLVWVTFKSIG